MLVRVLSGIRPHFVCYLSAVCLLQNLFPGSFPVSLGKENKGCINMIYAKKKSFGYADCNTNDATHFYRDPGI